MTDQAEQRWSTASFRVFSDLVSPETVADQLKLRPTWTARKGAPRSHPHMPPYEENRFLLESPVPKTQPPSDHIDALLEILEPRKAVLDELRDKIEIDIVCGFASGSGQDGFVLDQSTIQRLAALGLELVLNLYPPEAQPNTPMHLTASGRR